MDEAALTKQMKDEEKLLSSEISKKLTVALNSPATRKAADAVNKQSGGWPYPPDREMMKLYAEVADKAWKALAGGYKHMDADITLRADKGKPPAAEVRMTYRGEFRGGKSRELKLGESIQSVARDEYGYDAYAEVLWQANEHVLGRQCKIVPAGFGIEIPRIWVPEWPKPPKATLASGMTAKAVKILYPTLSFPITSSLVAIVPVETIAFTVLIKLELEGSMKAQKQGTLPVNFNLRSYEADITRNLGPLSGNFKFSLKEGKGVIDLSVSNAGLPGLNLSTKVTLKAGRPKVTLGTREISFTVKDVIYKGSVTLSAEVEIIPKPLPESAPVRAPARAPTRAPVRIEQILVLAVIAGAAIYVAAPLILGSGGTAVPLAAGAAVVVVGLVSGGGA